MSELAYFLLSTFGIFTIGSIFYSGVTLGKIQTKIKNIESDISEIKDKL